MERGVILLDEEEEDKDVEQELEDDESEDEEDDTMDFGTFASQGKLCLLYTSPSPRD
jgi:hypothetical protein